MLLIRRYGFPLFLAALIYGFLCLMFDLAQGSYVSGAALTVLSSYFTRVCDDLLDFSRDQKRGKVLFGKKTLIILAMVLTILTAALSLATHCYLFMFPFLLVSLQFLVGAKYRNVIKPLFVPAILITLFLTVFVFDAWVFALMAIALILDIILVARGESDDTH